MKHLHLSSPNFKYLEKGFAEWLDILGYSRRTVQGAPVHVRELFHYLEGKNLTHLSGVKSRHVYDFVKHLKTRRNLMHGGCLSASSLNSYVSSLNLFARYVNQTGKHILDVNPVRLKMDVDERAILTQTEIKQLYEATFEPYPQCTTPAMGQRDRAIIAIFYGCGLRKNEGSSLDLSDIDLVKRLVLVRHGKGNKQRYVPIATKNYEDIRSYIEEGRYWFVEDHTTVWHTKQGKKKTDVDKEAFFLNQRGCRMQSFYQRFSFLREKAGIETHFSTHNLRHSIATHLLQSGMPIEEIARFLGHASLESTQIYTHIVEQIELSDTDFTRSGEKKKQHQ